jgi:FtsP/CotA-like multicopper oxidase with cupredoxin domain
VGPGGSQEAAFALRASVPAGAYHVACDSIVTDPVDVTYTLIWRRGDHDTTLAEWTKHWDPLPGGNYDAQAYEVDEVAPAIDFEAGDELVFRYAGANTTSPQAYIPNGDGANAHGRIPSIRLPH